MKGAPTEEAGATEDFETGGRRATHISIISDVNEQLNGNWFGDKTYTLLPHVRK